MKQVLTIRIDGAHGFKELRIPTFLDNQSPELADPLFARDGIGILLFSRSLSKMPLAAADRKKCVSGIKPKRKNHCCWYLTACNPVLGHKQQILVWQSNIFLTSSPGRAPSRRQPPADKDKQVCKNPTDVMIVFQTASLSGH